jgi:cohesin loading factor subunit SCC2
LRSQDDVEFIRYIAENICAFEYKSQEELFTIIKHLTAVLSTFGMQLVDIVSPADLLAQLHGSTTAMEVDQVRELCLRRHMHFLIHIPGYH